MIVLSITNVKISGDADKIHPAELKRIVDMMRSEYGDVLSLRLRLVGGRVDVEYFLDKGKGKITIERMK